MTNVTLESLESNYSSINHGWGHKAGGATGGLFPDRGVIGPIPAMRLNES